MLRAVCGFVLALALAACGSANIQNMTSIFSPGAPRPEAVVVADFEFSPDVVLLDKGFAAQLRRRMGNASPEQVREELAGRVSEEIVGSMITTLREAGLTARKGGGETIAVTEPTLLVTGKVRAIDQGNRARRTVIGFGAGKSEVVADVAVSHISANEKKEILTFSAEAESGRRPGALLTAPVAAARGAAAVAAGAGAVSEKLSADVEAHARRLGQAAARRIIAYAAEQGWVQKPGT